MIAIAQEYLNQLIQANSLSQRGQQQAANNVFPKIGDTVRIIAQNSWLAVGTTYIVTNVESNGNVHLENGYVMMAGYYEVIAHAKLKKKIVKKIKPKITLESVIIDDAAREHINATISQVKHNDTIFTKWGFSEVFEKGTAISLLFWGIPGTGKTLMAQAIAESLGHKLKKYDTADIQSSEPGGAERAIQGIFKNIKEDELILLDECDTLLMDRNEIGPILGAMVNTLLKELEHYSGVIIFTTNRLGRLDAALERRITAKIEFKFPTEEQRVLIWKRLIPKKAPLETNVSFEKLAEYPLAGGNIKNAVLQAARMSAYKRHKKISMDAFVTAVEKEQASLKAFLDEFEKQDHTHLAHDYSNKTGMALSVKEGIKTEMQERGDNY